MHREALLAIEAIVKADREPYETIRVNPLTPVIGAEIEGVDLAGDLSNRQFAEVRRAFLEHHILVFPCRLCWWPGPFAPRPPRRLPAAGRPPRPHPLRLRRPFRVLFRWKSRRLPVPRRAGPPRPPADPPIPARPPCGLRR